MTGFGGSINEIGVFISVRKKFKEFIIYGWAEVFNEMDNNNYHSKKSGQEFLLGICFKWLPVGTIELYFRRRTIADLVNPGNLFIFKNEIKNYYTLTVKNILK